ncbi:uncharacterized protein LOC120002645 [Tripterygium wilfordii]|uniref:uncharacterized protein LOC120002645 n=1 Tax=Tripterygium wilfordii TaxID=458696 RepID=UPI0018F813CB|nr:uncharacterized protein LOC120002645 [Tripterygium wilfordii]
MNNNGVNGREDEISRKRRHTSDEVTAFRDLEEDEENELLSLSLSFRPSRGRKVSSPGNSHSQQPSMTTSLPSPPRPPMSQSSVQQSSMSSIMQNLLRKPQPQLPLQPSPSHPICSIPPFVTESVPTLAPRQSTRTRRNPTQAPGEGKSDTIPAPYPWSTNQRATVHNLEYLLSKRILTISGEVQCKRCEKQYEMEYDLRERFDAVATFLLEKKSTMHERAPSVWMNPVLPSCRFCEQENSAKPVISKKREINWLFLLLGQTIGCCTLDQLKYFCKHTRNHRTGAKDRILYLAYLTLCKQLVPTGPFNR